MFDLNANVFVSAVKLAAIVFGLIHLGVGLVMFRQLLTMSNKVATPSSGCLRVFSLIHILLLAAIIVLVVFI